MNQNDHPFFFSLFRKKKEKIDLWESVSSSSTYFKYIFFNVTCIFNVPLKERFILPTAAKILIIILY